MSNRVFHPEISHAIEEYFTSLGITQAMAAHILGVTPQAVSLQLRQPFGKNVSAKWSKAFGFNRDFLITGEGELLTEPALSNTEEIAYHAAKNSLQRIKEQVREDHESAIMEDMLSKEAISEEESYRKIDISSFISDSSWDSERDYNLAVKLGEIFRVQLNDAIAELEYLSRESTRLKEENKKLFIENSALRRLIK